MLKGDRAVSLHSRAPPARVAQHGVTLSVLKMNINHERTVQKHMTCKRGGKQLWLRLFATKTGPRVFQPLGCPYLASHKVWFHVLGDLIIKVTVPRRADMTQTTKIDIATCSCCEQIGKLLLKERRMSHRNGHRRTVKKSLSVNRYKSLALCVWFHMVEIVYCVDGDDATSSELTRVMKPPLRRRHCT